MPTDLLNGISQSYPETIRPAIQVIGAKPGSRLAGIYMMIFKKRVLWFADTTVNIDPTAEELADIAIQTAELARASWLKSLAWRCFLLELRIEHSSVAAKVKEATEIVKKRRPDSSSTARCRRILPCAGDFERKFSVQPSSGQCECFDFPGSSVGEYRVQADGTLGAAEAIGPILVGMNKPVFVFQQNSDVNDVVNMAAITAMEIQL